MSRFSLTLGVTLLALCAADVTPAAAQALGSRPLFGDGRADGSARRRLHITASVSGSHDSAVPEDLRSTMGTADPESSLRSTLLSGGADLAIGQRTQFMAAASSVVRYAQRADALTTVSHTATAGFATPLPASLTLSARQTATLSPSYLYGLLAEAGTPVDVPAAVPDYAAGRSSVFQYGSAVTLGGAAGRRGGFVISGDMLRTIARDRDDDALNLATYGAHTSFTQRVGRNAGLSSTYRYRSGNYGGNREDAIPEHGATVAMTYSWPLSATRRATLSAGVGPSAMTFPSTLAPGSSPIRRYRLDGSAAFGYELGRSWQLNAGYRRSADYLPGLTQPVAVHGVNAGGGGRLTPRMDLRVSAGYASGEPASGGGRRFDTYTGDVSVGLRLTSLLSAFGQYYYYYYDLGENAALAPGVDSRTERHGVRAGASLWMPVLRR